MGCQEQLLPHPWGHQSVSTSSVPPSCSCQQRPPISPAGFGISALRGCRLSPMPREGAPRFPQGPHLALAAGAARGRALHFAVLQRVVGNVRDELLCRQRNQADSAGQRPCRRGHGVHGPLCRTSTGLLRPSPPCGHSHAGVRGLKPCPVQVIPCDSVRNLGRKELEQLHGPVEAFPYPVSRGTAAAPYPSPVGRAPCPIPSLCVGTVGV